MNGILYAMGGADPSYLVTGAMEAYDPATDTWTTRASPPQLRVDFGVGVISGNLYAAGGRDAVSLTGVLEAYRP